METTHSNNLISVTHQQSSDAYQDVHTPKLEGALGEQNSWVLGSDSGSRGACQPGLAGFDVYSAYSTEQALSKHRIKKNKQV